MASRMNRAPTLMIPGTAFLGTSCPATESGGDTRVQEVADETLVAETSAVSAEPC